MNYVFFQIPNKVRVQQINIITMLIWYQMQIQACIIHNNVSLTLDPNKTVEEVEFAPGVGPGTPVGPSDLVGLLCKAGVLSNLVQNMWRQGAIFVHLDNHT